MALIVENGWGLRMAHSYASVEEANLQFRMLGRWLWSSVPEADKAGALLEATELLDSLYEFGGEVLRDEQALAWPRHGLRDEAGRAITGVPRQIVDATLRLAYLLALPGLVEVEPEMEEVDSLLESFGTRRRVAPQIIAKAVREAVIG